MSEAETTAAVSGEYPSPVSPPYPAASKDVELRRAMTASARSAVFTSADIVFEDEWLAVVDKPAGVYCDSLLSALPRSAASGCPPRWEKIKICSGHGRSKHGAWRVYAMPDVGRSLPGGSVVRDMSTQFEVLGVNGKGQFREPYNFYTDDIESITVQEKAADQICNDGVKNSAILVRSYPQSGRTHQIRLHCQYLGFPIRGDVKYGGVIEWDGLECDGHALHAESLSFVHPITGLPVNVQSTLPSWAKDFISTMQ
nr:unnamed protein product [Digitaria exilis]